jgi:hypothetical protein
MTKLTTLSATIALSMMAVTPVFAQWSFEQQEPSAAASHWRPTNVRNVGSPARSMGAMAFLAPGKSHQSRHVSHH